jgi:hypothetical protein
MWIATSQVVPRHLRAAFRISHGTRADILPVNHPNITQLILNPAAKPLPFDHPPIEPWIGNI